MTHVVLLRLTAEAARNLSCVGVMDAVAKAAAAGDTPSPDELVSLGQDLRFAQLFVARLRYLIGLRDTGVLRAAGPFEGLRTGMYILDVSDEDTVHSVMAADPFRRAGLIEADYEVRRWLAAI